MVIIPIHKGCYYVVPIHEFNRYWIPEITQNGSFDNVPRASKVAALQRGKPYKREQEAMERKGTTRHAKSYR